MTDHQINFIGWILFLISAVGFCIASIGSFWAMFGSIFFLVACVVFMVPYFRKSNQHQIELKKAKEEYLKKLLGK